MVVDFSIFDCTRKPTLVLKNLDGTPIQTLGYAFHCAVDLAYNEISTLTFELPAHVDGQAVPHYDEVVGMRIIDLVGCGQFLLIDPEEEDDGIRKIKSCKAYSLEYEFAKKDIFLEAGTFNFFDGINTNNPNTIVGRIREVMPDWTFDIDTSLVGKYRTFDDTKKKVYDFIKSDLQEKYGCIFDFDTYNRVVHVISVASSVPTKQIYLSSDSLIKKIEIDEDSDSIVTCLDVSGADDVSIRSVNPTGTNKIYNLDYFMNTTNFSQEMIDKWRKWEADCASYQAVYYDTTMIYNMKLLAIVTAQAELADLEAELTALQNVQATVIQGIAQGIKTQSDLDDINSDIADCRRVISVSKEQIASMKEEAEDLYEQLYSINDTLVFENYFTDRELRILRRYFLEDSIQDNSFVAQTAVSYHDDEYTVQITDGTAVISAESEIATATDSAGNTIISFVGGSFTLGTLTGGIIRATLSANSDGTSVFAGYLENGEIGEAVFDTGNITISGKLTYSDQNVTIANGRIYFTENANEYTKHQVEWELLEYGTQVLAEHASPTYNFSVDCVNFLNLDDYIIFRNQLTLGQRAYLHLDDAVLEPYVVEVHLEFDDPTGFTASFSSSYTSFDKSFALSKLLDQSVSMGKTLNQNSGAYGAFVNSGASSAVKDFMDSALDIAKNAVLSSKNQAITFDDTGIRVRKWKDKESQTYEPEEIWIVDNVIAFTDDNWATAKMAIGKVFDPNLGSYTPAESVYNPNLTYYMKSGDTYIRYTYNADTWADDYPNLYYKSGGTAYGIVAPYIVGTLLAGQNLVIDTENGCFRVDSSGVYIDSLRFYITHEDGTSDSLVGELDARDDAIAQEFNDALKGIADNLEAVADGQIVTYYQADTPADAKKGDLWFVTDENAEGFEEGKLYRHNGASWDSIADPEVVEAVKAAGTAQATADKKIVSYYQAETPTECGKGDIWYVTGENSDGFTKGKLYRYDSTGWNLVEDSSIQEVKDELLETNKTLSKIIDTEGYLKADMMSGVIDSSKSQMQSATGNVLFDSDGIWLLNATQKELATKAIWMNENGMLFGSGTASADPANTWDWTTAINHNGIVAEAIAAGKLSGMEIVGGSLNIGNGTFVVDSNGNLKATSGTFSGTVKGATFQDSAGNNMMSGGKFTGDYLDLSGINVGNGNFVVDDSGNVTVKGTIVMGAGSSISWSEIDESGSTAYKSASSALDIANIAADDAASAVDDAKDAVTQAGEAYDLAYCIANGIEIDEDIGTFINGHMIYSPEIYANEFYIKGVDTLDGTNLFKIYTSDNDSFVNMSVDSLSNFRISAYYLRLSANMVDFSAVTSMYCSGIKVDFTDATVDFSGATVTGLNTSSVAVFG